MVILQIILTGCRARCNHVKKSFILEYMYNISVVIVLILIIFFLSNDKKFSKLFNRNRSLQIIVGLILAYFSLNNINFGILLVTTIFMVLRYSYINSNLLYPLKDRSPIIKDLHKLIEKFSDGTEDDDNTVKSRLLEQILKTGQGSISDDIEINKDEDVSLDIKAQNDELKRLFADLDKKMNSMLNK